MRRVHRYLGWLTLIVAASLAYVVSRPLSPEKGAAVSGADFFDVARVIDGDTLKLSDGRKVRLIGVDTPEAYYGEKLLRDARRGHRDVAGIQSLGRKASAFTRGLCRGRKVRLEFDVEKHDRYKRWLAYVYLDDGTFLNAEIIKEGYGQVMTVPPNIRYADHFRQLEKEAREGKKGLWQDGGGGDV